MRWCVALGIVLATLVALTVKVSTRRPRAVVVTGAAESDEPAALQEPAQPAPPPSAAPARHANLPTFPHAAAAHLFGRVLPSADEEASFDDLTVTADDGARSFVARVLPEGRFTLHLPAGRYTVTASLGDRVGIAPSVAAGPGGEREVTIQLGTAAAIRGHVRGPEGVAISVRVSLAGRNDAQQTVDTEDGDFSVEDLIPGRRYDLTFAGDDLRTTSLRSVTAPAERIAAVIDALPILRGAVGFPSGERCPIERVVLREPGAPPANDEDQDEGSIDDACRFQLSVPDGSSQMVVVATGAGEYLEELVPIPPLGDPAPICLNPPCRANPLDGLARVRFSLDGPRSRRVARTVIEDEFVVQ